MIPTIKTQESIALEDKEISGDEEDAMRSSRQAEPPDEELQERGSPVEVQQALHQEGAAREAGEKELPEQGSPVEVQQVLHQDEAAREAGEEELPERGSPVEVQQTLHQEEAGREAGAEDFPERGSLWSLKTDAGGEMRRPIIMVVVEEKETRMILTVQPETKQGIQFRDI